MYFDWTYFVLVLPAMLFAMWASLKVDLTYKKYNKVTNRRGITGAEAARRVLDANGLSNIRIEHISGDLTDHFDPAANVIRLSDSVYGSTSTAAIGVACHEVGHAVQHAVGYVPIKIRTAIVPITNFGSKLAVPLIIVGILLSYVSYFFTIVAYVGLLCFALSTIFQLVTLPTEFNASKRAMQTIESMGLLYDDELKGARKTLTAAAMTYVAALAVSLAQLLRFLIIISSSSRRD